MKKTLLLVVALAMLFTACTKETEPSPPSQGTQSLTIEQAKSVLAGEKASTRSGSTSPIVPTINDELWSRSTLNSVTGAVAITTPIVTQNSLSATVWDVPVTVTQKIVVLDGTDFDRPRAYIQTYIPTFRSELEFGDQASRVTHLGDAYDFTGWILTHTFDGTMVALEFVRDNQVVDYIITHQINAENYDYVSAYVANMMQGVEIFYPQSAGTRAYDPEFPLGGIKAPDVISTVQ